MIISEDVLKDLYGEQEFPAEILVELGWRFYHTDSHSGAMWKSPDDGVMPLSHLITAQVLQQVNQNEPLKAMPIKVVHKEV